MSIEWKFDLHLDDIAARVKAAETPAAMAAMELVRAEVAQQTPVETGNLVGSEEVAPTDEGARIFIPGPYARRQHYGLDFHHNTGNALFLELPMITQAPAALRVIGDFIRKAM